MDFYRYFGAKQNSFWQWEDSAQVLAIPGGSTIAYREQVLEVLDALAQGGVPRLGPLLLTLMATGPNGEELLEQADRALYQRYAPTVYIDAFRFLRRLASLPALYKTGNKRRLLLQTIFRKAHNLINRREANRLLRQFRTGSFEASELLKLRDNPVERQIEELRVLALLGSRFPTVDSILLAVADVPELPEPPLPELPPALPTDEFLKALIDEPQTFEVGVLIKWLWSGLAIPFQRGLPSERPLGGISDLSNRGDLSRLLLTEYANDDLLFLTRLANGEALFLNREIPPATNDRTRVVLIDVSLRAWGTPRTVAFAVLLALARHLKADLPYVAFAVGDQCQPLAFGSIHQVIDSMQQLSGALHPATGLTAFFSDHWPGSAAEVFFLTTPAALRHPALLPILHEYREKLTYLLTTDATGQLTVYQQQSTGRKALQTLSLPLGQLWTKPTAKPAAPAAKPKALEEYPILFPPDNNPRRVLTNGQGNVYMITTDRLLLRHYGSESSEHQNGWELLCPKLPPSSNHYQIGRLETGEDMLLLFDAGKKMATLLNLVTHQQKQIAVPQWKGESFVFLEAQQAFFLTGKNRLYKLIPFPEPTVEREEDWTLALSIQNLQNTPNDIRWRHISVFKKITRIGITTTKKLLVNKHQLSTEIGVPWFSLHPQPEVQIEARRVGDRFCFPDGSEVVLLGGGMLQLMSRNTSLPSVFLPSVLDMSLGMATDDVFGGNDYFCNPSLLQPRMPGDAFFQKYVQPFLETILIHAIHA